MQTNARSQTPHQEEQNRLGQNQLVFVAGDDSKKIGIVQSVIGHLGLSVGSKSKAGIVVLVEAGLEMVTHYRDEAGDSCWILVLTETGSAAAYLSAGASDVLTGAWSVNALCDRIDVAQARFGVASGECPPMMQREDIELVATYSRGEAVGMVEWMLRAAEDTITRMMLAHAIVEKKCRGVTMAVEAVDDLRQMTSELAAAVRASPDDMESCDLWSVLAGGLGFPLLGEGRSVKADLPERLPALLGSRHRVESALRSLVMPLVRDSCDGAITVSVDRNELGGQLLIHLDYKASDPIPDGGEESPLCDSSARHRRTTDRLFAVAAARIASLGGELLAAERAGFLQLRLPVMGGSVESSRVDTAEPTRVVLIEPDDSLRSVLEQYFCMQNVHTLALPSLERAGEILEHAAVSSFAPDVWVVAVRSAAGEGECEKLRRISRQAPLIATLSGDSDEVEVVRRIEGVSEVLRKPYTAETLLELAMELAMNPG